MLVTTEELGNFLAQHSGQNRICAITTLTPVKMVVKHRETSEPNPWMVNGKSQVNHLQERLVNFGANYQAAVNRVWAKNEAMVDANGNVPYFVAEALWKGRGQRVNHYMARHTETGEEYLVYLQAIRGDRNISLRQEAYFHRFTGLPVKYEDFAPYLVSYAPSTKQHPELGNVLINARTIHIENVLSIRSFDLIQPGKFDLIVLHREPGQTSV